MLKSMVVVFSFVAGWALVRLVLKRSEPFSTPVIPSSAVPEWLERHQLLHMQSRLTAHHHSIQERRQEAERRRLHLHLSPHFMFNALTSVHWLAADGRWQEALHTFVAFKGLWNKHWNVQESPIHSLQDELETLQACVVLESTRLGKDVTFTHHMPPAVPKDALIPALLLQPALENALWHGFDGSVEAPHIHLEVTPLDGQEGWLGLTLLDNGVGLCSSTDAGSSEGLQLVREKVKTMAEGADVCVGPATCPWSTMARITLPLALPECASEASEATVRHPVRLEDPL